MGSIKNLFSKVKEHNGITFTRLPNIRNVAVVENLDGLALWADRKKLDINGIIVENAVDEERAELMAKHIVEYAHSDKGTASFKTIESEDSFSKGIYLQEKVLVAAFDNTGSGASRDMFSKNIQRMGEDVQGGLIELSNAFLNVAKAKSFVDMAKAYRGKDSGIDTERYERLGASIRVNNDYPKEPRNHMDQIDTDTLIVALSQGGTTIYSDTLEHSHQLEAGQAILMDHALLHSAAEYDESWEEDPRVNLIIG